MAIGVSGGEGPAVVDVEVVVPEVTEAQGHQERCLLGQHCLIVGALECSPGVVTHRRNQAKAIVKGLSGQSQCTDHNKEGR